VVDIDYLIHEGDRKSYVELGMFITIPCIYQNSIEPNSPPKPKSSTRHEKIRMSLDLGFRVLELLHQTIELQSVPSLLINKKINNMLFTCLLSKFACKYEQRTWFLKKRPPSTTHGKTIKFLFQVSIFTLKIQCLVTKGNIASIGSDDTTSCLTSDPAFIDFQPAKQSNLFMQTKLTNTSRSMAPTSFRSRVKHFQLMYFPCLPWFGNSDHGLYILLTSLPQCVVCDFERVRVWLIIAIHPIPSLDGVN
jgi:hypothetical protein